MCCCSQNTLGITKIPVSCSNREKECKKSTNSFFALYSYGHGLAQCVQNVWNLLQSWNLYINSLHATAQLTANQVQNLGLNVLSQTEVFDGRDNLPNLINTQYRELLKRYLSYRERFDGFLENISSDVLDTIAELVNCDEVLEEQFRQEVTRDLARARGCVGA